MTLGSKTTLSWQAKTAFACTALFSLTSISTNAVYGWSKGDTLPSQMIWSALAIAVGATLLLATAAFFKSLAARNYGQAIFIALGLSLCASYSVIAAVGSATGQRMSASLAEDNAAARRSELRKVVDEAEKRLGESQKAISAAEGKVAALPHDRPSSAIEAEIQGILLEPTLGNCREIDGPRTREKCPHVADLKKELANALSAERERQSAEAGIVASKAELTEWQAKLDKARSEIAALPPPKVENSDAKSIVAMLQSLGFNPTVAQVNTALALLAVLLIEMGGSVSLAVGMALSVSTPVIENPLPRILVKDEEQPLSTVPAISLAKPSKDSGLKGLHALVEQAPARPLSNVRERLLIDVNGNKGGLRSTYEALASRYGVSATRIGQVVRDLKKEGVVRVRSSRNGTTIAPVLGLAGMA